MSRMTYPNKMRRLFWAALLLYVVGFGSQVATNPDPGIVGFELAFTENRAGALLNEWGDEGKARALENISLDFVFIAGYVSLLVVVIFWTMREESAGGGWLWKHGKKIAGLAVAAGGLDVIENLCMRHVVESSPGAGGVPVAAAGVAATLKLGLILFVIAAWARWVYRHQIEIFRGIKLWIIDFWSIFKICRASLVVLTVGAAFLVLVPQGRDVVIALAEPPLRHRWMFLVWFFIAAGFWALNIWYWARIMLRFEWDEPSAGVGLSGRARHIRKHFPRLLGTLAFVAVAAGFLRAAVDTEGATEKGHWILAAWAVVLAVFFYTATAVRRDMTNQIQKQVKEKNPWKEGRLARLIDAMKVHPPGTREAYGSTLRSAKDLEKAVRLFLGLLAALTLSMFILFAIDPGKAEMFRSAPILLLAAAAWVPVGTLLVYLHYRYRFPLTATLVAALVVFSYTNDNHAVRTLDEPREALAGSVAEHFPRWLAARGITGPGGDEASSDEAEESEPESDPQTARRSPGKRYPVFVVAAEGGGIRAAYWTATVLGKLQDVHPGEKGESFADHVYAISGVSGGSLGGAVFSSLVKEQLLGTRLDCPARAREKRDSSGEAWVKGAMEGCVDRMLRRDFLSPTLAAMLYPDLVQRFLIVPIPRFDRGRALEKSWERGWDSLPGLEKGRFGGGKESPTFDDLWRGGEKADEHLYRVPLLFLNSTWVETGKRVLISPIGINAKSEDSEVDRARVDEFADSQDYFEPTRRKIRLSSAVHNSARFTFVSPAGTVKTPEGDVWGHVVDGGYFENSGATTALEILEAMERGAGDAWSRVQPIVLMITNDPALGAHPKPRKFLKEALSPVVALLQTRGARGSYSRDALKDYVVTDCLARRRAKGAEARGKQDLLSQCEKFFAEVDLKDVEGVPLGWVLSGGARKQMNLALDEKTQPVRDMMRR